MRTTIQAVLNTDKLEGYCKVHSYVSDHVPLQFLVQFALGYS